MRKQLYYGTHPSLAAVKEDHRCLETVRFVAEEFAIAPGIIEGSAGVNEQPVNFL